jgi:hypothetical protein
MNETPPNPLTDNLWRVSDKPPLTRILAEFQRSGGLATCSVNKLRNDRIRFCRWEGRSADYKKHREAIGQDPVPYEGAWDQRVYAADGIIEDLGAVLSNAFARAQLKMRPSTASDIERAAQAEKVLSKFIERDRAALNDEADLMWQLGLSYGAAMWQVYWDRTVGMKLVTVTWPQVLDAAVKAWGALNPPSGLDSDSQSPIANSQAPLSGLDSDGSSKMEDGSSQLPTPNSLTDGAQDQQLLANAVLFPTQVLDPDQEDAAVATLRAGSRHIAAQLFAKERDEYGDGWLANYQMSMAQARKAIRDLRTDGKATFPAPYLHKNAPCVVAREVGFDYFAPPEMTETEASPWHIVRDWLPPSAIMENKVTDGWDPEWCERAIKTAGQTTEWGSEIRLRDVELDDDTETFDATLRKSQSGLVEVLHCFARYVTEEGIPQVWCTVFSAHALKDDAGNDLFAKHYATGSATYGFVPWRWQKKRRNFHQNFGIPEFIGSDQQLIKRTCDQLTDRADMELNPPWLVANRLGMRYKAGAGAQVPVKRKGDVEPMIPPPGSPELGVELIKDARYRLDNYFGLMTENVLPARWQMKLQALTSRFLTSCAAMFKVYWALIQANADERELSRLAGSSGRGSDFPRSPEEIEGEYDVSLYFDVKDLDMEFVFKKLDAVAKMAVPLDRAGTIDLSALVRLIVLAIDPTYAQALITDKAGASARVYKDVDNEVMRMFVGNEAEYVENDPTAGMKLKFLDQVLQANPRYVGALSGPNGQDQNGHDPLFMERLMKYRDNLQQSVTQEQNKQVGRLGVVPDSPPSGPDSTGMDMGGAA